ncbi:MAG: BglI family type II restriction endonuclease [Acidobacteriota bacterium]|nr:BglI family type II restriction endonuclease [Acidobacteriota bacterium]
MPISVSSYNEIRASFIASPENMIKIEKAYMDSLLKIILAAADDLYRDFCAATELGPFWLSYAPKQRGRQPMGTSIPWIEVGEKSLSFHLLKSILEANPSIGFPGLPFGGDVRFSTEDAFVHVDVKLTGPHDNPDEIVVPPQQISGDGAHWGSTAPNSTFNVVGPRARMPFQPKLPPFYILGGKVLLCLTFFVKGIYRVEEYGIQPLDHMELICVPNGLLLFDTKNYARQRGLFIPGKDDRSKPAADKRTRIRLDPLCLSAGAWRCVKIEHREGGWVRTNRSLGETE